MIARRTLASDPRASGVTSYFPLKRSLKRGPHKRILGEIHSQHHTRTEYTSTQIVRASILKLYLVNCAMLNTPLKVHT